MQPHDMPSAEVRPSATTMESIIVPTDGSTLGELGATFANFFATRFGGEVRRFTVPSDDVAGAIVQEVLAVHQCNRVYGDTRAPSF